MKRPLHYIILCCLCTTSLIAQQEIKWGKISSEELSMTSYEHDPEASAVVLADVGNVEFEFRSEERPIRTERHIRIKFLTQAGIEEYGDVQISYYSEDNYEFLTGLKAQVFLPDGSEVAVGNEHMFKTKENDRWTTETIAFPSLVPGAVVEYRYTIMSGRYFTPVDWFFQREIPVVYSDLTVKVPHWYDYVILQQGRPVDDHRIDQITEVGAAGGISVVYQKARYISTHLEGLKSEKFVTTMDDYYSRIRYQLREINPPNKPRIPVFQTWQLAEEEVLALDNFGKAYRSNANGEAVLAFAGSSVQPAASQLDQAKQLFDYLSTHLRWNERYSDLVSESINQVLKRKEGTSGELNLALLAGLHKLGIDAAPVMISTRSHGKVIELYPIMSQFNHTLVHASIDGKDYLLDVAANQPFGFPRHESLNYQGWRVEKDSSAWINIYPEMSQSTYFLKLTCTPDAKMEGTLQGKFTAYHGARERNTFLKNREDYFNDHLKSGSHTLKVDQFEIQNEDDFNQPWSFNAQIKAEPGMEVEDYMYLSLPCIDVLTTNPFTEEKRTFPVEISYPYSFRFIIDIMMPEGYIVESLPKDAVLKTEDGGITFVYRCSENQGRLQMRADFGVSNLQYAPEHYGMLKLMFDQIVTATGEQVVLKKST